MFPLTAIPAQEFHDYNLSYIELLMSSFFSLLQQLIKYLIQWFCVKDIQRPGFMESKHIHSTTHTQKLTLLKNVNKSIQEDGHDCVKGSTKLAYRLSICSC